MRVLYVSYNEKDKCCVECQLNNGPIDNPIRISNESYLIYESKAICKKYSDYPTKILIRVTKKGDFYLGDLIKFEYFKDCDPKEFKDQKHRPVRWIEQYKRHKINPKSIFFISNLKKYNLKGTRRPRIIEI